MICNRCEDPHSAFRKACPHCGFERWDNLNCYHFVQALGTIFIIPLALVLLILSPIILLVSYLFGSAILGVISGIFTFLVYPFLKHREK